MRQMIEAITEAVASMEEMTQFYIARTKEHIRLVRDAIRSIVDAYPEYKELLIRGEKHDQSKFEAPEAEPYIYITWMHKSKAEGVPFEVPEEMKEKMHAATQHHILTNPHHPEYWVKDKSEVEISSIDRDKTTKLLDVSVMPDMDVVEMVADWQAMSIELKKNTAREWYNKQKGVRWQFTEVQDKLIDKLLKVFE